MSYIEQPVHIEDTAPPEHVEAVVEAFARAGFEVEVARDYLRKSAGDLPWIVRTALETPIEAFFAVFGAAAGKHASEAVKEWLQDVWTARSGAGTGEGSVVLSDPDTTNLVLSSSLPDEAIDALREIDWNDKRGGYLVWDHTNQTWRDATR